MVHDNLTRTNLTRGRFGAERVKCSRGRQLEKRGRGERGVTIRDPNPPDLHLFLTRRPHYTRFASNCLAPSSSRYTLISNVTHVERKNQIFKNKKQKINLCFRQRHGVTAPRAGYKSYRDSLPEPIAFGIFLGLLPTPKNASLLHSLPHR